MSEHYERHAVEVADTFFDRLDEDVRAKISDAQRNELAMLIEAAISTAVFDQLEHTADEVATLAQRIRHHAEHYDKSAA